MKRKWPAWAIAGFAIGTFWGRASRHLGWASVVINCGLIVAFLVWSVRSLRELRAMEREMKTILDDLSRR